MADGALIFPAAEFERRAAALQQQMARDGIDALLLTNAADITYLAGFLTRFWESPTRPWFLVLPADGAPVAVIPAIGKALMDRTWVKDIRTWASPDPDDDGTSLLADTIREQSADGARIGMAIGPESALRMPLVQLHQIERSIGGRVVVDATQTIHRVREIKSEPEINRIRAACRVADLAFARVPDFARAGSRLDDVFRSFQCALLESGADWVSYTAGGAGPGGYFDVISPADGTPLRRGDVLMLDTGAVVDGYFCDFDRNFSVGAPAQAVAQTHAALIRATDSALAQLRPGLLAEDAHRIMADALVESGATPIGGRFGHGLGLSLTEWPSLQPGDTTPLRAGMVLTLEPGAEVSPGRILVHEENIVLRPDGAQLLSARAPRQLPILSA